MCNNCYYDSNSAWSMDTYSFKDMSSFIWERRWSNRWLLSYKNIAVQANDGVRAKNKKKNIKDEMKSKDIRDMLNKITFVCAL